MPSCMVVNCGNRTLRDVDVHFYRIPSIYNNKGKECPLLKERRDKWIRVLKREDVTETKLKYGRICSKHFITGKPAKANHRDDPDWIPSQEMGYKSIQQPSRSSQNRYHRIQRRKEQNCATALKCELPLNQQKIESIPSILEDKTVEDPEDMNRKGDLDWALRKCNEEIYSLREKLKNFQFNEDYFKNSDSKTLFYTGLVSYQYLECVYELVEPYITVTHSSVLPKFQQLVLTLMKLRLNLLFTDLGYRFGCHYTTASRIFSNVVEILFHRLKNFITWPDRDALRTNIPNCFKENFSSATVIIDCFEVFVEKSSNLEAVAKTWYNYKHHQTVKFLIGITVQGQICFISNAYGGRASDRFITEDCGFLNHLLPGDVVLSDRGFTIDDSVKLCFAEVIKPVFKKGRYQLSARDVEDTRKLANVRIHVERVIGLLQQKYTILNNKLPLVILKKKDNEYAFLDKIVVVCCALINLCPPIVPL